ncbi:MAG: Na/Pi cotransporter family protein [Oscillospiraceae bacterium]|nr:Na/Pi cotransporter family protein [Oscillospiraceae bacterium]
MSITSLNWGMILGGFGLFMFGIKFMGDGLKDAAGDKLRDYINKYTSNPVSALVIGIIMTIIMQSSSATSAISIGLVRAGLMTLEQAVGVILGATIGTTATSFLISINIDKYAMFIVFAGTMLICFSKKQRFKYYGNVILGFGLIFFGMSGMGDALASLKEMPRFEAIALRMSEKPLLAMLTGVILTAAVQSSAATIGVIQKLYRAGAVTFSASLPFMFGANVGTTMTGILASLGGTTAGKRTAAVHTTLNVISATIGMLLLRPYSRLITRLFGNLNPMMQIAMANIVFKVITTLLFLPFTKELVKLVKRIVPGEEEEKDEDLGLSMQISEVLPSAAVKAAESAVGKMVRLVGRNISGSRNLLYKDSEDNRESLDTTEARINRYDKEITDYLIALSLQPHLSERDTSDIRVQFDVVKNYERAGDLAENLWEFFGLVRDSGEVFTRQAIRDIGRMFDVVKDMFDTSYKVFLGRSTEDFDRLQEMENELDRMEIDSRRTHFERMSHGICTSPVAESIYCDILGTLERIGDHCCNVGKAVFSGTSDISPDEKLA